MKKLTLNFVYVIMGLLLLAGCKKDNGIAATYTGDYCGSLKADGTYSGVWTADVSSDGNINLSVLDGIARTLSGTVSSTGEFSASQADDSQTETTQGTIDSEGNVIGTWGEYGTVYGELRGGIAIDNLDHIGTWYETTPEGYYYKMVISETTFAQYSYDDMMGNYYEDPIEEGSYTIVKNNITASPSTGGTESGKVYVIDGTLILTLTGLSTSIYGKLDPSV